jgi:hydrogenase maturation protease
MQRAIVLGIGNTLVSDDGVGIYVVQELRKRIFDDRIVFDEFAGTGLDALEHLKGYDYAILVDAAKTGCCPVGSLALVPLLHPDQIPQPVSLHAVSICTAIHFGALVGLSLPRLITMAVVEVADLDTLREACTTDVEAAIPRIAAEIIEYLRHQFPDLHTPAPEYKEVTQQ